MTAAGVSVAMAALPKILNMTVPQVGHLPLMALRPFFIVSSTPSEISFLALHLTQYPSGIKKFPLQHFMRCCGHGHSLGWRQGQSQSERAVKTGYNIRNILILRQLY